MIIELNDSAQLQGDGKKGSPQMYPGGCLSLLVFAMRRFISGAKAD
jgi:hypothetical protein